MFHFLAAMCKFCVNSTDKRAFPKGNLKISAGKYFPGNSNMHFLFQGKKIPHVEYRPTKNRAKPGFMLFQVKNRY
jgi:hypothetical protein